MAAFGTSNGTSNGAGAAAAAAAGAEEWTDGNESSRSQSASVVSVAPVKKPIKLHALAASNTVSAADFEAAVVKCWQTYQTLDMCDADDQTPLHKACARGQLEHVRVLVMGVPRYCVVGADVNAADALGRTPLMLAAQVGHFAMVQYLLTHGADPKQRDSAKRMAHHYASTDAVKQLVSPDGGSGNCRGCSKGCTVM